MHCEHLRNVNHAMRFFGTYFSSYRFADKISREPSRAGEVLKINSPVTCTYDHPWERVLFNQARDANPFFHLFEALWMLAGRNDVAPLAYFNSQISEIASDDGKTFNGAYGYRWRNTETHYTKEHTTDQLQVITDHLRANKSSRRAVLQMWNVEDDLLKIDDKQCSVCLGKGGKEVITHCDGLWQTCSACDGAGTLAKATKDVCCNTCIYFTVRAVDENDYQEASISPNTAPLLPPKHYLDMVVCNRSNDLTWGMLGANYVHFTILQEYMAAKIGVEMGLYHHFTSNLHVYTSRWNPGAIIADVTPDYYTKMGRNQLVPLVEPEDVELFDQELPHFIDKWLGTEGWDAPFLGTVAQPMFTAFYHHKQRDYKQALSVMTAVESEDWRLAGIAWIEKRQQQFEKEQA